MTENSSLMMTVPFERSEKIYKMAENSSLMMIVPFERSEEV
jgi:hypothetical protein